MNSIHERQGTGAIREIPPTTDKGRITALENKVREQEFQIKTLTDMVDRLVKQVVGEV